MSSDWVPHMWTSSHYDAVLPLALLGLTSGPFQIRPKHGSVSNTEHVLTSLSISMPPLVPRTYSATSDLKDGRSIAASIQGNPSACIQFLLFIIIDN